MSDGILFTRLASSLDPNFLSLLFFRFYLLNVIQVVPAYSFPRPTSTTNGFGPSTSNSSPTPPQSSFSYESTASGPSTQNQQPNLSNRSALAPSTPTQLPNLSYEISFPYTQSFPSGPNQQMDSPIPGPGSQQTSNPVEGSYPPQRSSYSLGASVFGRLFSWTQAEPGT
jgi:hypothetical protein